MCAEFAQVFELCQFVMQYSEVPSLVEATLQVKVLVHTHTFFRNFSVKFYPLSQTLLRFLSWIPIGYIFEFDLISVLVSKVCLFYFPPLSS